MKAKGAEESWVDERTAQVMKLMVGRRSRKKAYSPKAEALSKFIAERNGFGCGRVAVRKLVEILVDEKLPPAPKSREWVGGGFVYVLSENPNAHNYPLGEPIFVPEDGASGLWIAPKSDEGYRRGNNLPGLKSPSIRQATKEEVRGFMEGSAKVQALRILIDRAIGTLS